MLEGDKPNISRGEHAGARLGLLRVTHVDSGHSVRGSWGDTRALHLTMEDDVRIKMNMVNVNDYLNLQAEAGDSTLLIKKVGRVFIGPTESMTRMHDLMSGTVHRQCALKFASALKFLKCS